jgi:dTDP-4-amino-4,6-dideoxygalactose transaminase
LPNSVHSVETSRDDLNHLFVVRVSSNRSELIAFLEQRGIQTKVHFPVPLHRQQADWRESSVGFLTANEWCESVLSLPCYPGLRQDEIERTCAAVTSWSNQSRLG